MSKISDAYQKRDDEKNEQEFQKHRSNLLEYNRIVDIIPRLISTILPKIENNPPREHVLIGFQGKQNIAWTIYKDDDYYSSYDTSVVLTEDGCLIFRKGKKYVNASDGELYIVTLSHISSFDSTPGLQILRGCLGGLIELAESYNIPIGNEAKELSSRSGCYFTKMTPQKTTIPSAKTSGCLLAIVCFPVFVFIYALKNII